MSDKLVSLLTPCYNTAKYIHRLLDSVLSQRYDHIEMVVVDDGSTDDSAAVVASYMERFSARGYSLRLIRQENQGQSAAINNGLKEIHGDYLAWPDSDDYYASEEAISKMVEALETHGEPFRMVRTQEVLVDDDTLQPLSVVGEGRLFEEPSSLFADCLLHLNDYYFYPGGYMVDVETLRQETDMEIFTDRNGGQNWQLMLPMLYRHRCLTLPEPLYHVVTRASSHSRGAYQGLEREMLKNNTYQLVVTETLRRIKGMPDGEREAYEKRIVEKYDLVRLEIALRYRDSNAVAQCLTALKRDGVAISRSLTIISHIVANPLGNRLYKVIKG